MKFLVVLLAVVALSVGHEFKEPLAGNERSISSIIVDYIEEFKEQMPCGFPKMGIPVLAPVKITHKELDIEVDNFSLHFAVDDFRLDGLDKFDVVEFKVNAVLSKISYKFHWHNVYFKTVYDLLLRTNGNFKWNLARNGKANFGIKDIIIEGTSKYKLGVGGGSPMLKDFYMYVSIGEVNSNIENLAGNRFVNRMFNDIIEEWITLAINENTQYIAEQTNTYVVPFVNDKLSNQSFNDIINGIVGGGSEGEGETGGEKEKCIPPEDA